MTPIQQIITTTVDDPDAEKRYKAEQELIQLGTWRSQICWGAQESGLALPSKSGENSGECAKFNCNRSTHCCNKRWKRRCKWHGKEIAGNCAIEYPIKRRSEVVSETKTSILWKDWNKRYITRKRLYEGEQQFELGKIDDHGSRSMCCWLLHCLMKCQCVVIAARDSLRQRKEPEVVDALIAVSNMNPFSGKSGC